MKRILSLILVVVVLIGMIACSKDAAESEDKENSNLNDMNNIGICYEEAIKYLQELGGNK